MFVIFNFLYLYGIIHLIKLKTCHGFCKILYVKKIKNVVNGSKLTFAGTPVRSLYIACGVGSYCNCCPFSC